MTSPPPRSKEKANKIIEIPTIIPNSKNGLRLPNLERVLSLIIPHIRFIMSPTTADKITITDIKSGARCKT